MYIARYIIQVLTWCRLLVYKNIKVEKDKLFYLSCYSRLIHMWMYKLS